MKRLATLAIIALTQSVGLLPAVGQATLHQLLDNGPTSRRINIVFLSEGYTSAELGNFTNDAKAVLNRMLTNTAPYNEYRHYFNAFAISIESAESGSDHPSRSELRNTYFNSTFDSYGIGYLVTIPPNDRDPVYANGRGKVDALLQTLMPEYDIAALIVNDPAYGGSGGSVAVASVNASSAEIMIHELGHSFARLGDEYATPYPGYPDTEEPNTTRETDRALIKWKDWILPGTPVPTPATSTYGSVVGLFEGAHYHATGWYRPKLDCKMRTLGVAFCEVCRQALVLSKYQVITPLDSFIPASTNVVITDSNPVDLTVTPMTPQTHVLNIQWFVNGTPVNGATNTNFTASASLLGNGTHTIRAQLTDTTPLVRNDPNQLLKDEVSWNVTVSAGPPSIRLISPESLANGQFRFTLTQTNASSFVIQSSTDLLNWLPLQTNNNTGGTFQFTDAGATGHPNRFYRALLNP